MKYMPTGVLFVVAMYLTACGRDTATVSAVKKSEGPPVNTLPHEDLMAAYRECTKYGVIDDPKVKYTARYCAAVQAGHLAEGYTAPSTAKVDPTLNKMH